MTKLELSEIIEDPIKLKEWVRKTEKALNNSEHDITFGDLITAMLQNGTITAVQFTKLYLHA